MVTMATVVGFAGGTTTTGSATALVLPGTTGSAAPIALPGLEAQQASIRRHPDARLVTLGIDAGGAHARRLMARAAGDPGAG